MLLDPTTADTIILVLSSHRRGDRKKKKKKKFHLNELDKMTSHKDKKSGGGGGRWLSVSPKSILGKRMVLLNLHIIKLY